MRWATLRGVAAHIAVVAGLCAATPGLASHEHQFWAEAYGASPARYDGDPLLPNPALRTPKSYSGSVRLALFVTDGGDAIRVRISNEASDAPLPIRAASVAQADARGVPKGSILPLTFGGHAGVTVPAGAPILSDAVPLGTRAFDRLVVTMAADNLRLTVLGGAKMLLSEGDHTADRDMPRARPVFGRPFVSAVEVATARPAAVVAALGDSLTDGVRPDPGTPGGYPAALARRFAALPPGQQRIIVNAGIGGNRLLADGAGPSALARLDRDVLRIGGLSHIILLEGINDIGNSDRGGRSVISPDLLIGAYRQIIARGHARSVKVIGATLLPFEGAAYASPQKERVRQAVNEWIRTAGAFDGVIDFERAMQDPEHPARLVPRFDSGDHLHPNDEGFDAMAQAIDLAQFR